MKNIHLFLDVFVFVVLVLIHLYGPARICDVTMSHTWIWVRGQAAKAQNKTVGFVLTFSFINLLFSSFRSGVANDGLKENPPYSVLDITRVPPRQSCLVFLN